MYLLGKRWKIWIVNLYIYFIQILREEETND